MNWLSSNTPLIIGHRGASAAAPENTLAAFGLALEHGAHGVELDVRLSGDGNVVVIHDDTVDRTTNGSGAVSRLMTEQLQALDAGDEQPIPTLDDVFQTFGPSMLYNLELKDPALFNENLEMAVADRIAAYHLENHVLVSCFQALPLRRIRRHLSRSTPIGLLHGRRSSRWLGHLIAPAQAAHPHYTKVDEAYMAWARQRNLRVHVWTLDDPARAQQLVALGVQGIITNRPALIREALGY